MDRIKERQRQREKEKEKEKEEKIENSICLTRGRKGQREDGKWEW